MTTRLDVALAAAGLARSRTQARRIVEEGRARVDGRPASRPSDPVPPGARLEVTGVPDGVEYASRAAHKLAGTLEGLGVDPSGRRCLDAGASTGGFSDVLLRRGALRVVAVDIGHDQLVAHVREDPRVLVLDGTSVRDLTPDLVGGPVELLVADLSFISLRTVLPALASVVAPGGELLLMVKPQFEVGRTALPRTGVVTDPAARARAVLGVVQEAGGVGLGLLAVRRSPLPGRDGNLEVFVHLRRGGGVPGTDPRACDMIGTAVLDEHDDEVPTPARSAGPGRSARRDVPAPGAAADPHRPEEDTPA